MKLIKKRKSYSVYKQDKIKIYHGDNNVVLKRFKDNSISAVVTDPPYSLISIIKRFGKAAGNFGNGYGSGWKPEGNSLGAAFARTSRGFMGQAWDTGKDVHNVEFWKEIYRVMKPGAYLLSMAGTRTYHRMVVAIEDAGFEIRDTIGWIHGQGFPKSKDLSKELDKKLGKKRKVIAKVRYTGGGTEYINRYNNKAKYRPNSYQKGENILDVTTPSAEEAKQFEGWGTALKPAMELIVVARRPLEGTVAENALRHGTGGLNIDACRIPTNSKTDDKRLGGKGSWKTDKMAKNVYEGGYAGIRTASSAKGRWPANLIHDGSEEVISQFPNASYGKNGPYNYQGKQYNVKGFIKNNSPQAPSNYGDAGSAARFFYTAKASRRERTANGKVKNSHPTVKPIALMKYLLTLVTPPGGIVLDPFAGSGSTGLAAIELGFRFIGIEKENSYAKISRKRITHHINQLKPNHPNLYRLRF